MLLYAQHPNPNRTSTSTPNPTPNPNPRYALAWGVGARCPPGAAREAVCAALVASGLAADAQLPEVTLTLTPNPNP